MNPKSTLALALSVLLAACIETPGIRAVPDGARPPPLRLVRVESLTADPERTGRVPELRLRFDRPVGTFSPEDILLVTGELTDSLRSDAAYGALSATHAGRRVAASVTREGTDPTTVVLRGAQTLLPDTALVLLVTGRVRAVDGAPLDTGDAGPAVIAAPLRVASARRCGALMTVEQVEPGDAPSLTSRVVVRFDRPVRMNSGASPFTLSTARGEPVAARASLDCDDGTGFARCGWIEPSQPLEHRTVYRVAPSLGLAARNGLAPEGVAMLFATGSRSDAARVSFGPSPVCATGESALGAFCVRGGDRWIELRASTTRPAIVRVNAMATAARRVALSVPGALHTVRVVGLAPRTVYALTVEALGADGAAHDARALGPITTAAALPRLRIAEVVARPRSTSAQEYIELVYEDDAPLDLANYALAQGTSRSVFPMGTALRGRGRVLVVGASFDPRGAPRSGDPPVTPGAVVITLSGSVAGRGLRDTGADVTLSDPAGRVLSFMPGSDPSRAPRAGVGIVRAETDLADEDPAAWSYDSAGGCTPGGEDRVP